MALFNEKELEILNQYKEELNAVETKTDLVKLYTKMNGWVSGVFLIKMILALALKMDKEEIVSVYVMGPVSDGICFELRFVTGNGLDPNGSLFFLWFTCTANTILANLPFSEKDLDAIYRGQVYPPLFRNQQARQFERDQSFYEALLAKEFSEDQTRNIIETAYGHGKIERIPWSPSLTSVSEKKYFNTDPSILNIVSQIIHFSRIYAYDISNHIQRLY